MIRIGVISAYPDEDSDAQRIFAAAARRGRATLLSPTDFSAELMGGDGRLTVQGRRALEFDLFLTPRALGESGNADVQLELYRALSEVGALVVNPVRGLLVAIDKFRSSWELVRAGLPTPPTLVTQDLTEAQAALARLGEVVSKPVFGSLGEGIERLGPNDRDRIVKLLSHQGVLYLQKYLRSAVDIRAFVVGDEVVAAIRRRPRAGEFRANVHQGASVEAIELDRGATRLAVAASRAIGLDYAGVDLLASDENVQVIEVNGTPSFAGISEATGRDMAMAIVEHAVRRVEANSGRGATELNGVPELLRADSRDGSAPQSTRSK